MHVAVVAQFAALLLLLLLTYFLLRFFSSFLHAVAFSFPLLCALSLLRATGCFFLLYGAAFSSTFYIDKSIMAHTVIGMMCGELYAYMITLL